MIHNENQYNVYLFEYEVLSSRFHDLTEDEKTRYLELESDLNMYDNLRFQKN